MNPHEEKFTIEKHKHKFAVWTAGRAASVKGQRFSVEVAKHLIESINLKQYIDHPDALPDNFDDVHHAWCKTICQKAEIKMNYGVAAKLINVYLKTILVCGGHHENEKVKKIHPPIDRILLMELAKKDDSPLKKNLEGICRKGLVQL